ncbi:hypothetical protein BJ508DRAFT_412216 [Ascobolus immersus RN42]|uniref:Uncharacterized protein n=1 Tax=Ascobolus immersus RN42 TaxID=1160509 RepID=A0A3N4IU02_ASCIM|nr:hypothetical protein BJ508DRAFT_412216 [Ascobolus immersus RN42]
MLSSSPSRGNRTSYATPPPQHNSQSSLAFSPSSQALPIRDRGTPIVTPKRETHFRHGEPISPTAAEAQLTELLKVDFDHQAHCQACLLSYGELYHCSLCPRSMHPSIACLPSDLDPSKLLPGKKFICPQHRCAECFGSENKRTRKSRFFFRCRFCDAAYCEACLVNEVEIDPSTLELTNPSDCPELLSLGYTERNERVKMGTCDVCLIRKGYDYKDYIEAVGKMKGDRDNENFSWVVSEAVGEAKEGKKNLGKEHYEMEEKTDKYWFQPDYQPGNLQELIPEVEAKARAQIREKKAPNADVDMAG